MKGPRVDRFTVGPLLGESSGPLAITAACDVSAEYLVDWLRERRAHLEAELSTWGAVLFRGASVPDPARFKAVVESLSTPLDYIGGVSPRRQVAGKVYESTNVPADAFIFPHNELCHVAAPPAMIWFFCAMPASAGGETPLFDGRSVLERLSPSTRKRLEGRNLLYSYRYWPPAVPIPHGRPFKRWDEAFGTSSRTAIEQACRDVGLAYAWGPDDSLETSSVKEAMTLHPRTGQPSWFNQILLRNSWRLGLSQGDQRARRDEHRSACSYADGAPIATEDVADIWHAMRAVGVRFAWQKDDILLVDNVRCGHGRMPFSGPRELLCMLADAR